MSSALAETGWPPSCSSTPVRSRREIACGWVCSSTSIRVGTSTGVTLAIPACPPSSAGAQSMRRSGRPSGQPRRSFASKKACSRLSATTTASCSPAPPLFREAPTESGASKWTSTLSPACSSAFQDASNSFGRCPLPFGARRHRPRSATASNWPSRACRERPSRSALSSRHGPRSLPPMQETISSSYSRSSRAWALRLTRPRAAVPGPSTPTMPTRHSSRRPLRIWISQRSASRTRRPHRPTTRAVSRWP